MLSLKKFQLFFGQNLASRAFFGPLKNSSGFSRAGKSRARVGLGPSRAKSPARGLRARAGPDPSLSQMLDVHHWCEQQNQ